MASGEYIQMSGRAGRRGKDLKGNSIMMIDKDMDETICSNIISGKPLPLLSNYKLTYYTLLNLLRRVDGTTEQEKTIERSFHQYQHQVAVPALKKDLADLRQEDQSIVCPDLATMPPVVRDLVEVQAMRLELMTKLLLSGEAFNYLCAGRLVHVMDGTVDWGWGIIVRCFKRVKNTSTGSSDPSKVADDFVLDVMLPCRNPKDGEFLPSKALKEEDVSMFIVPVTCSCVAEISSLRVGLPLDLKKAENRRKVQVTIVSLVKKHGQSDLPLLHPTRDMGLQGLDDLWFEITMKKGLVKKHRAPLPSLTLDQLKQMQRRMEIATECAKLEEKIKDSQVTVFNREIKLRSAVLENLGHINSGTCVFSLSQNVLSP